MEIRGALPLLAKGFDMAQVAAAAKGSDRVTLIKNRGRVIGCDFMLETSQATVLLATIQLQVGGRNVIESALIAEFDPEFDPGRRKWIELNSSGGQTAQWNIDNTGAVPLDTSLVFFHENRFNCKEWWLKFRKRYTGLKTRTYPFSILASAKTTVSDVIPTDQGDVIGVELVASGVTTNIYPSRHTVRVNGEVIFDNVPGALMWPGSSFLYKVFPILIKRSSTFEWDIDNNVAAAINVGIKFYFDDSE